MSDIDEILESLLKHDENELVEFKTASNSYDFDKIGKYFSALSNEANLKNQQCGWLIFGVNDSRQVVGTEYRNNPDDLNNLKYEIAKHTTGNISFIEIFERFQECDGESKRVLMFKIPAAITAVPTGWKGQYYAREGENLVSLSMEKIDRIRNQALKDWSKALIPGSSIKHLDSSAIQIARKLYKEKINKSHIKQEVDSMDDETFLTKLRLIRDGQISRAAMVLLGNPEHSHLLDRPPSVMWRLFGANGQNRGYEIFEIPFINVIDKVFQKIQNLTYRYMPNQQSLFPIETLQYDQPLFYELFNNCLAHQDYTRGARIYIDEYEDRLVFTNPGTFIPQTIRNVLNPSYAPPFYRNQLLAETMMNMGMIDTASMGIRRVFNIQRKKYFPLPDYDILKDQVVVTIYGKILNIDYTQLLFDFPDISLDIIFLLDRVQKGKELTNEEIRLLRKHKLIEGKKPNLIITSKVAESLGAQAEYIKNRGFNDQYFSDMIVEYLKQYHQATREDIRKLLLSKLPDVLSSEQKENKIKNLIQKLRLDKKIEKRYSEKPKKAYWVLCPPVE
ncbi:MAG: putative DNA binding domain-containing protein [Bacilli bacterium]|nr:putative DNA binding domain-containing protein [Thermoguttaceae bacterium]MBR0302084.1 putative DNA binding domain-containing protein [Bacilli bacterium]